MAFNKDFLWGAASAASQVEGGILEDGRTLSIWDVATDNVVTKESNAVACDHYHRYKEDVSLMKKIGLKSYRFSISWSRIIPAIDGKINEKGVEFYLNLIYELKKSNIEPLVTLYHWDMPIWLYEIGGWKNPESVNYFIDFVKVCVEKFSPYVKYWFTFNEPQCFINGGLFEGWHAPFEHGTKEDLENATRNVMLAHGKAVKFIRENAVISPLISFAPTSSIFIPTKDGTVTEEKAKELMQDISYDKAYSSVWWSDPIILGKAPKGMEFLSEKDLKIISQPLDFYSFNIYDPRNYWYDEFKGDLLKDGTPKTPMGWIMCPDCIYFATKYFYERYKLPIMISENGLANFDFIYEDGKVHDPQRKNYILTHLKALKKANDEGVPVIGYQYWAFSDNWEWTFGLSKRFGLIYIDYESQKRIVKDSALLYKRIIKSNGKILK